MGYQNRTRLCDNPTPQFEGEDCTVDGGWGDWSEWKACPVSCGGGYQNRTRLCDNPSPQFEGEDCTVDGSLGHETQKCNENPCPIDGGWGDWSTWETCPVSCGGG